jgi:hypothetical protein
MRHTSRASSEGELGSSAGEMGLGARDGETRRCSQHKLGGSTHTVSQATDDLDLLSLRLMKAGRHRLIRVVATATVGQGRQLFHRFIKFSSLVRKHYGGVL